MYRQCFIFSIAYGITISQAGALAIMPIAGFSALRVNTMPCGGAEGIIDFVAAPLLVLQCRTTPMLSA